MGKQPAAGTVAKSATIHALPSRARLPQDDKTVFNPRPHTEGKFVAPKCPRPRL